jgi:hypothetical protein
MALKASGEPRLTKLRVTHTKNATPMAFRGIENRGLICDCTLSVSASVVTPDATYTTDKARPREAIVPGQSPDLPTCCSGTSNNAAQKGSGKDRNNCCRRSTISSCDMDQVYEGRVRLHIQYVAPSEDEGDDHEEAEANAGSETDHDCFGSRRTGVLGFLGC